MKSTRVILSGKKAIELPSFREKSGEIMVNATDILRQAHTPRLLLRMNLIGYSNY